MKRRYAGIGSRATPPDVLEQIGALGTFLAREGWLLRSGAADGADAAFEAGCKVGEGASQIFLPWRGFNCHPSKLYPPSTEALELAATIHPGWPYLSFAAKLLHARNVHQVLGQDLVEPVDCVICWTPVTRGGKVSGGTATAVNLARSRGIPVFNMYEGFYFGGAR